MMNLWQVKNIVAYIQGQGSLRFEAMDVQESLEEILARADLDPDLTNREWEELRDELLRLVLKRELNGLAETLDLGLKSGLDRVGMLLHPRLFEQRRKEPVKPAYSVGAWRGYVARQVSYSQP